jgi:predicted MFS family arabinose efflux permease
MQDMTTQKILSRDFILCFFAQFSFSLVFCLLIPTIPIYLSRFEAKEAEIGFLIGIFSVSSLILRPVVGRALLSIPERNFMIPGTILYVFSSIAYLLAPPFWPLFIVRVIHGIGLALFSTAIFTLVANITPERHRGQLISYFYLSFNMAFALGPYFGMLIINQFNFVVLFWVCTGLSLCSLFITLKLGKREVIPSEPPSFKLETILTREALPPSLIAFMLNIIWGTLTAFLPLHALRHGVSNPGIFFIFLAITLVLGRILGGKILDIYDRKKVIVPCLTAIFISMVILTFSTTLPMFILVAVILGTGWALLYPSLLIYAIENAGSAQGPAMATFTALGDLGAGIGPMIMGIILQGTSYPIMFSCLALTGAINFLYFYYVIGKGKKKADQMMDEGTKEKIV